MVQTQSMLKNLIKLPNVLWGQTRQEILRAIREPPAERIYQGQFSFVQEDERTIILMRDRLGLNKLFYHIDEKTKVVTVANYVADLAAEVWSAANIYSVPVGHYVTINKSTCERTLTCYYDISNQNKPGGDFAINNLQNKVIESLTRGFEILRWQNKGSEYFVCLSGGLDSAVIANFAKKFLSDRVRAVTYSYASQDTIAQFGHVIVNPPKEVFEDKLLSDDFHRASRIAALLGLEFVGVLMEKKIHEDELNSVLANGQDWRDFNVHCAWVNFQIAKHIKKDFLQTNVIFLTGDLMNEFVADYAAVPYKGAIYYPQPKINKDRLRKFFVYGLDAGDREIGIFHSQATRIIQPYALVAETYLEVPGDFLEDPDAKQKLNAGLLFDAKVLAEVSKKKLRSQVGGEDGGTLGLFHDAGITENILREKWVALLAKPSDTPADKASFLKLIYAGRYRH